VSEEPQGWRRFLGHYWWIGLAGGVASGLFGIGGAVILVPLLARFLGLTQQEAHGTSLAVALFTAPAALIAYAFKGHVDLSWALVLAAGSVVGAPLGARWANQTSAKNLRRAFGALIILLGIRLALTHLPEGNILPTAGVWAIVARVIMGFVVGVASGYFGVGGGTVLVPMLVLIAGLKQVEAQGISLLFVIPTAASGAWTHRKLGNVDGKSVLPLALWSMIGAFGAALLATSLSGDLLRRIFSVFLFLTGLKLTFTKPKRPAA
jgi:uncharacterized membrane protein YfcA